MPSHRIARRNVLGPKGFLTCATLAVTAPCLSQASKPDVKRPNILWLIAEDMGKDLGCYGTREARTPRLDHLASQGVRYTHAYTVTAVCSSSRSSFMTGMYAFSIGAHNHRSHRHDGFRLPNGVEVLSDTFRRAGYFTANIRTFAKPGDDHRFFAGTGKTDWNFTYTGAAGKPFDTDSWDDLKRHEPFFAQVNFSETHRGREWNTAHRHIRHAADPARVVLPTYYPDHPIVREDWAQYLNAVMALDRKAGYVLDRLKEDGLDDNTIVLFFGDNGRAMMRDKQWPYESGLSVPFIIRYPPGILPPAQIQPGRVDDRMILSIDWAAASLWMAGIARPEKMQGRSFLGPEAFARELVFGGRDRGDETVDRIRTVRDKRYRYIRNDYPDRPFLQLNRYKETSYPTITLMRFLHERGQLDANQAFLMQPTRPPEELYDLQTDPHEIRNLAADPAYVATLRRLRTNLDEWIVQINDQGRFPEPPEVVARHESEMRKAYETRLPLARQRVLDRLTPAQHPGPGMPR